MCIWQLLLFASILSVTALSACAQTSPAADDLAARLTAAEAKVAELEAARYAKYPAAKAIEKEYQRVRDESDTEARQISRRLAGQFIEAQKKRGKASIEQAFRDLRGGFEQLAMIDAIRDPTKAEIIRMILADQDRWKAYARQAGTETPVATAVAGAKSFGEFWGAFPNYLAARKTEVEAKIEKIKRDAEFPDAVVASARESTTTRYEVEGIYAPYIELTTSPELREARSRRDDLIRAIKQDDSQK
jgi:outer membrane murein-binding lipoprotein Lpp